jgi:hypothetical protein
VQIGADEGKIEVGSRDGSSGRGRELRLRSTKARIDADQGWRWWIGGDRSARIGGGEIGIGRRASDEERSVASGDREDSEVTRLGEY